MSITHVSDTAKWVAVYRAMETERPDAIFRDPFARRLAGEHGERIVRTINNGQGAAWAMIVRTAVMDEMILAEIAVNGIDCVINLAAGLDARPFRLALPPSLRWIDVDFQDILDYKWEVLRHEKASCLYETAPTDLTDGDARRALFARIAEQQDRVLVVAEGLLLYLSDENVAALATDLHGQPAFHSWLIDLASARLLQWMQRSWGKTAAFGNAPFRFAPAEGTAFFERSGWREREYRSAWTESKRLKRTMRGAWLWGIFALLQTRKQRAESLRMSGFVMLDRT
ncbi:MAG: class I SAM-dependent methyltransferase [Gemmatimonadaceae bacterium]